MGTILQFPNVAERARDEAELAAMAAKRDARAVARATSEYLNQPLRTEQEVRAARLHPLFQGIVDAFGLTVRS